MSKTISIPSKLYKENYGRVFKKEDGVEKIRETRQKFYSKDNPFNAYAELLKEMVMDSGHATEWKWRYPEPETYAPTARHKKIVFHEQEFILIGDAKSGGAIATEEQLDNFEESYAHLYPDGLIRRHHQVIGKIEEIVFLPDGN